MMKLLGSPMTDQPSTIKCDEHETGYETFICEHLLKNPNQLWCSRELTPENQWPDSWCLECDAIREQHGGWNENTDGKISIKLVCHQCYNRLRAQGIPWE